MWTAPGGATPFCLFTTHSCIPSRRHSAKSLPIAQWFRVREGVTVMKPALKTAHQRVWEAKAGLCRNPNSYPDGY